MIIATADSNASLGSINIIDTVNYTSTYTEYTVDLDNVAANASRVVFMIIPEFVPNYTYSYAYAYVDDIRITQILPCETPGKPSLNYATSSSASLSWDGAQGSSYTIKYGPSGFNQSTGATQVLSNDSNAILTGLQPNTEYDVLIQNNCSAVGDGLSYWSQMSSFKTACIEQGFPLIENFESTLGGSSVNPTYPECWEYTASRVTNTIYGYNSASSFYANDGVNSFRMFASSDSTTAFDSIQLLSPNLGELADKSIKLNFAVRPTSVNYSTVLYVMAFDSTNALVSTIDTLPIEQIIGSSTYESFSYTIDSLVGANKIGFQIKGNGNTSQGFNIDDIEISEITECYYVQQFKPDSVGLNMAQFSWDARFSDSVQVTIIPEGLAKINGTSYSSASGTLVINGLIAGASYDVYFDEFCSTGLSGFEQMTTITTSTTVTPCDITFQLYDSYGDGWNGHVFGYRLLNTLNDTLGNGLLTMSTGSSLTITESSLALYQTDSIEVYYVNSGSYASEVSMLIYDGSGNLVDSVISGGYFAPFRFAPGCSGGTCFAPALSISTGLFSASFMNTSDSIRYSVQSIGTVLDSSSVIESTDTIISLDSLNYNTGYQVYYQVPCSSGGWTPWAVKFFETSCDQLNYSFGGSPSANTCSQLLFSEYIEGSSNNKGFEIYNPSDSAISLNGYTLYLSGNGGSYTNTFTSNATIASGDVYVIVTNQADTLMQAQADTALGYPSVAHYNGDDALILVQGMDTIDIIGVAGEDPGSSWIVDSGSTANHTLVRKSTVNYGSTDWTVGSGEWDVYAQNTYSNLGLHSYNCSQAVDTSSGNNEYCYGESIQYVLTGNAIAEEFKWYKDGVLTAATTTPVLSIPNVTPNESGTYSVLINNRCGIQELALGSVSVADTIGITAQLSEINTCLDLDAQISFVTSGPFLNMELSRNAIPFAYDTDSLLISNVGYADSGIYELTISNGCETKSASAILHVIEGTTITSISPETYVCTDSTEAIYVAGLGNSLQYAWTANGVSLANSDNDTILIPSPSDSTFYAVQVSGICSADTSKVSLANSSVVIRKRQSSEITTSQSDLVLCEGQTIDMGFEAIGHNLQYSWLKDGDVIIGTNDTTYDYVNAMHEESGTYQFAISGTCGADTSAEIDVTVRKTTDYISGMSNIEVCVGDEFTMPLSYDGHDVGVSIHKVGSINSFSPITTSVSGCTELFFSEYIEGSGNNKGFEIFNPSSSPVSLFGYTVYLSTNGGSTTTSFVSNSVIAPGDVYVITTNQAALSMQMEADTVLGFPSVAHFNGDDALILMNGSDTIDVIGTPGIDPGSSWSVSTGSTANNTLVRKTTVSSGSTDWNTAVNEWNVYPQNTLSYLGSHTFTCANNTIMTSFGLSNISYNDEGYYYAKFDGSCGTVYSDTVQVIVHTTTAVTSAYSNPLNVICEDAGIDLSFAVEGHGLTYAWNQDGSAAGSDSTLQIITADTAQSGYYQLITSGVCGVDSSQVLQLIVHPATRVLSTLPDTAICQDADITLPPVTDGFNVTYKWYQNGVQISTSSSLVITDGLSSDNGEYQLGLNGYCGADSSNTFDVLVMPTTEVLASLGDTTTCIDDAHLLAVEDTGYLNTYQWYKNGAMLSGETDSTLSFNALTSLDTGLYQLVASGSCGTDSSSMISLGAWKTTTVTASSPSFDICKSDQALMFMDVEGDFLTYSWAKDGFNLPGSTNDTLILNNVQPAFAGYFIGTATGICGTSLTDSIEMNVHQVPNVVQEPLSDTLCQYDNTSLTVNATGFGVTYEWYSNGVLMGSGSNLALDSITYVQQGNYIAVADGFCGIDSSQAAFVKVDAILPSLSLSSYAFEICELDTVVINASSLLGQSVTGNWYKDSMLVHSGLSYNLTDSGGYYVALTDLVTGCMETTPSANVIMRSVPEPIAISGEDTLYQNIPNWYWVNQEANVDYDWSIPSGVIVAGWFSDSIEVQFSGSGAHMVYVEATNEFECTTNLDLEVLISGIGFDENKLVNFKVYPNPTAGRTVLELDQAVSADMNVEIIDAKGAIVYRGKLLKGATEYRMDMSTLRNGQYLIQIPQLGMSVPIVKVN